MITNQKIISFKLFSVVFLLFSFILCYGQQGNKTNYISKVIPEDKIVKINITPLKGEPIETDLRINTKITSGSILKVPSNTIVYITSSNGNIGKIKGPNTVQFTCSENHEEYLVIDGSGTSNIFFEILKELTGGVLASGPTKGIQARSRLTEFLVRYDGNELEYVLIKGKIDVNRKEKVEIKDEDEIDNIKKRALFVRKTTELTLKDSIYLFNSNKVTTESLTSDKVIKKFFKDQLNEQMRTFKKAGPISKQAFKLLDNDSIVKGTELLERASENGELTWDLIIQSSLMISDAYFNKGEIKKSSNWLDAGLHFSKFYYDRNKDLYDHYSTTGENNGNNKITKAFGNDLIFANEYFAWAYALKLKINGCLENASENPSKYRIDAKKIEQEIEGF